MPNGHRTLIFCNSDCFVYRGQDAKATAGETTGCIAGPQALGEFQTKMGGRKRTSPRGLRHLPGVIDGEIAERHCSFLFHTCNSNPGDSKAETFQKGQHLK